MSHYCIANLKGELKCWGPNFQGQLGLGDTNSRGDDSNEMGSNLPFVKIGKGLKITDIATGHQQTCIHLTNNKVKCWGNNFVGQLGPGIASDQLGDTPQTTPDLIDFVNLGNSSEPMQVSCGLFYTCILFKNRQVRCFGDNSVGQIGWEEFSQSKLALLTDDGNNLPFINFGSGIEVQSIHSSYYGQHNCMIASTSQLVKCWGYNKQGQLGYGDTKSRGMDANTMGSNLLFVDLGNEDRVKLISVGATFTCALRVDDELKCFGQNVNGQLGIGSTNNVVATGSLLISTPYDSEKKVKQISSGYDHFCILFDDNLTVKCVGGNQYGQLGQGDKIARGNSPLLMIPNITAIDFGTGSLQISFIRVTLSTTHVIFVNNKIKSFGYNGFGGLGYGDQVNKGDNPDEMGTNLSFVNVFQQTNAPTKSPISTKIPTTASHNASLIRKLGFLESMIAVAIGGYLF